ncbi:MAG: hypothetical protein IJC40_04395 [Muribaculaceae bacterium]|nr:hypothetical protein [Muribaculaceae bacterium]
MLGLKFHNLTRLDLAFDDTRNLSKRIIRAIRNEALIPIVNGTKITDRDKLLEDILYIGVGSCCRIKEYSLIVQQKNGDLRLSAYNKKREIESNSGKQYIAEANGNPNYLFRLEVRVNGDTLREYFQHFGIDYNPMRRFPLAFIPLFLKQSLTLPDCQRQTTPRYPLCCCVGY